MDSKLILFSVCILLVLLGIVMTYTSTGKNMEYFDLVSTSSDNKTPQDVYEFENDPSSTVDMNGKTPVSIKFNCTVINRYDNKKSKDKLPYTYEITDFGKIVVKNVDRKGNETKIYVPVEPSKYIGDVIIPNMVITKITFLKPYRAYLPGGAAWKNQIHEFKDIQQCSFSVKKHKFSFQSNEKGVGNDMLNMISGYNLIKSALMIIIDGYINNPSSPPPSSTPDKILPPSVTGL